MQGSVTAGIMSDPMTRRLRADSVAFSMAGNGGVWVERRAAERCAAIIGHTVRSDGADSLGKAAVRRATLVVRFGECEPEA